MSDPFIVYCHCAYAQVVPREVKEAVLRKLAEANVSFEAVADLCECSARRDASLQRLASAGEVKILACYPRAVKWLFAAAQAPLSSTTTEVINMRIATPEEIAKRVFTPGVIPNLTISQPESQNAEPPPVA